MAGATVVAQPPGPGGGGFGGRFQGGPPNREDVKLVAEFDANGDGWLDREERDAARKSLADRPRRRFPGFGPPGGPGDREARGDRRGGREDAGGPPRGPFGRANLEPPKQGPHVTPGDVESHAGALLYDPAVFRTVFLDFESDDWEAELADFKDTDVEVPATLTVDGVEYPNVGVKFRGMSSFMMVPAGYKRSLNVSLDFRDEDQRLAGYKTLNLLNCMGDPSLMSTFLYSQIARERIAAPKANFVRVVINGECWGVYANAQQIDKIFMEEYFGSSKGTRWKVPGSPGGDGGLRYMGEDVAEYKSRYEMKSDDDDDAWRALVELCRVLKETPDDELEAKLEPMLDVDGALWFLALDNALVNSDGYWTRASDYYLFRDGKGKFHVIPSDINEAFQGGGGPFGGRGRRGPAGGFGPPDGFGPPPGFPPPDGFGPPPGFGPPDGEAPNRPEGEAGRRGWRGRGPGGMMHGGPDLDPLIGLDNERTPLRGRLLSVPHLREKYLAYVREIAKYSLDWDDYLGPLVADERKLIEQAVKEDTKGMNAFAAFDAATSPTTKPDDDPKRANSLRDFAAKRRAYLLDYKEPAPTKP